MDYSYCCCICCLSEEKRNIIKTNKEIEHVLSQDKRRREIKVLLLGTGDSGKTTFLKQMYIIHGNGYSEDVRRKYSHLVFRNVMEAMHMMTYAMEILKIPYSNPQNEIYAQQLQDVVTHQEMQLKRNYVEAIHHLWADQGFKICYERRREYQLPDSAKYFIDNLDRIAAKDYTPTNQDILSVRHPTTGITEHCIRMEKLLLRFLDVGGQKSERRKWIHYFENVMLLIYVASLSEYDQCLEENNTSNRMKESLALFYTIIHSKWLAKTSIVLFLNKTDILAEKIQFSDLKTYFPEFEGKHQDAQDAMLFIRNLYTQKAVSSETRNSKNILCHFICAMDTTNTRKVFDNVKDFILTGGINEYNIL